MVRGTVEPMLERLSRAATELGFAEVRILETAAVVAALLLMRTLLLFLVRRNVRDVRVRYHARKGVSYTLAMVGLLIVGRIWFVGFRDVATILGLVAAGLVITLKEPVLNMAGWVFLIWRTPFALGDRIQIGQNAGDVIDRRLFQFSILEIGNWVSADQSTGRIIHIPNGRLFTEPLANYTREFPYIWNEVEVTITFESDWQEAKQLLLTIGERHRLAPEAEAQVFAASQHYLISYSTVAPTVYTSASPHGIVLALRYMCAARQRRGTSSAIWEAVLEEFGAHSRIDVAYATTRFFDRSLEQKTLQRHEPAPDSPAGTS
jgi:small-conductance mechanosensitive channel